MKNKSIKKISWFILVIFLFTLFNYDPLSKEQAEAKVSISGTDFAVLVGDLMSENGLGEDWSPANNNGKLKEFKKGIYEGTFKLKKNKSYKYKIALNGTWKESYGEGDSGDDILLNTGDSEEVTFRLDLANKKVYDSINNPEQFKTKAIVTGDLSNCFGGGNWQPDDDNFKLSYIGGGMYKGSFPVKKSGKTLYKTAYNGSWNNGEIDGDNKEVEIPEGTSEVAFFADYIGNDTSDSINNPELNKTVSLLGTIRDDKPWDESLTDYDMYRIDGTKVMYTKILNPGSYEYKAIINHQSVNGNLPKEGTNKLNIDSKMNVIFIADTKTGELIDSVNYSDKIKEALGLLEKSAEVTSPVVNDNGTITFNYRNENASTVYLSSNLNGWSRNSNELKRNESGVWSVTIRPGDDPKEIQYKFIVDGKENLDQYNKVTDAKGENSIVKFNGFKGRPITLPGSLETGIEGSNGSWNPADKAVQLEYVGNGNYKGTMKVKAGRYEYKAAVNYTWDPENYGADGVDHGSNIPIVVPKDMEVTFYYNDDSHKTVNSINYKVLDIALCRDGNKIANLTDNLLNGIYSGTVSLKAGEYNDLSLKVNGDEEKNVKISKLVLDRDKTVTFSYDPESELCFNDASDNKVSAGSLYYDSRDEEYKNPYGAVSSGTEISFALKADKDALTEAKFILGTPEGTKVLDMNKNGSFADGSDKWTVKYTPENIGTYSYYFAVSNGSDVKAYGDDDGYFGKGTSGNLGEIKNYEFNVSVKDFKTPDWLKNGVIYQIYPDRFFNGDLSNDFKQKYARGNTPYEFPSDWYSIPKDADLMDQENYPANKGSKDWANDLYGGDLKGIEKKVKYLKALGVTILYLNPIGQSISSHRYDTTNYKNVDPLLGTMDNFVSLAKAAKENGMHIILDGVYNHVCDDSIYFDKYGKYISAGNPLGAYQYWKSVYDEMNNNGLTEKDAVNKTEEYYKSIGITDFHYKDWFVVKNEKYTAESGNDYYSYEGWSGFDSMPVIQALNGSEYNVTSWADEIINGEDSVAKKWLREGSSGWRLDVANEVSDETWRAFRKTVKGEGDYAIIGEIWNDASRYILGDMYDSVMNYRFRTAILNYVKGTQDDGVSKVTAKDSMNELEKMREQYPLEALEAMMNLMGSHDTQRVISALDGYQKGKKGFAAEPTEKAKACMKLIPLWQMTYIGAPTIYYGDEIGMAGCDDPDNRRAFAWGKGDKDLVQWYAYLAAVRREYSALRTGLVKQAEVEDKFSEDVMSVIRSDEDSKVLVASNRREDIVETEIKTSGIEDGTKLINLLNKDEVYTVKDGKINVKIPALSGVILTDKVKDIQVDTDNLKDAYDKDAIVKKRTTPKSDAEIIDEINNAKDGDSIVVSENEDSISLNVLKSAKSSGKNLKYIVKREDGKVILILSNISKLEELAESEGISDLRIEVKDVIKNELEKSKADYVERFNISTNLKEETLGGMAEVQVKVYNSYNDKELNAYFINSSGNKQLLGKGIVKNGLFIFDTDMTGDYLVSYEERKEDNNSNINNSPNKVEEQSNVLKDYDENKDTDRNDSLINKVRTGDDSVLLIAPLIIAGALILELCKRKKLNK